MGKLVKIERPFLGERENSGEKILAFKEEGKDNFLLIEVKSFYAALLDAKLGKDEPVHALPHDLLCETIEELGAKITHGIITEIEDDICYAELFLEIESKPVSVECGPLDILLLYLKKEFPIYAPKDLFVKGSWDTTGGETTINFSNDSQPDAFTELIERLDELDKFDQGEKDED